MEASGARLGLNRGFADFATQQRSHRHCEHLSQWRSLNTNHLSISRRFPSMGLTFIKIRHLQWIGLTHSSQWVHLHWIIGWICTRPTHYQQITTVQTYVWTILDLLRQRFHVFWYTRLATHRSRTIRHTRQPDIVADRASFFKNYQVSVFFLATTWIFIDMTMEILLFIDTTMETPIYRPTPFLKEASSRIRFSVSVSLLPSPTLFSSTRNLLVTIPSSSFPGHSYWNLTEEIASPQHTCRTSLRARLAAWTCHL